MPVFRLSQQLRFPPPDLSEPDGLLAVGGDLSPPWLLLAYSSGVFPWFNEGDPVLWWSPDPRCVLELSDLQVSRSLARVLRRGEFAVTFDRAFARVVSACAAPRSDLEGTWITAEMEAAYGRLHELGYAHSVECWREGELVGGLYGVCLGRFFFGESMFHSITNASKVAFVALARHLAERGFELLDCQLPTAHLFSLGAREMPRGVFLERLRRGGMEPSCEPLPGDFS
ncbi:MAG: leucyl/phenylalanyl-tRNA--protein transferase [Desulfuromonas sp.]|uniref:leucyl/phenylalanyl-tRNA--protein transferase n=1 Tax=Desulfuromonas sp. TaxID=892 RepID=UPI000CB3A6CC|nr:leucyl/phenylalanyl-tRNA--protein transferase [Desulfuromonas sp.]PLX82397.1 MAG: leucyl/phenylalanyl-tRNA--protein transferase [Desulfuromonas sp.]